MNCKPNELAVVVMTGRHTTNTLGRIVRVLKRVPANLMATPSRGDGWTYEGERLRFDGSGRVVDFINDCCLRPIRPNDGEDETLQWAGKPEHVKEEA